MWRLWGGSLRATKRDLKDLDKGKIVIKRDKKWTYLMLGEEWMISISEDIKHTLKHRPSEARHFYQPIRNEDFIDESHKNRTY